MPWDSAASSLAPCHAGKGRQGAVRRSGDKVDLAVAHRLARRVDRKDVLQGHVEAFALEKTKFDGCDRRKVGVGNEIGDCDFHRRASYGWFTAEAP